MKTTQIYDILDELQHIDWVEDAFVDTDCVYEGGLNISIVIKEEDIDEIAKEYGYN